MKVSHSFIFVICVKNNRLIHAALFTFSKTAKNDVKEFNSIRPVTYKVWVLVSMAAFNLRCGAHYHSSHDLFSKKKNIFQRTDMDIPKMLENSH